MGGDIRLQLGRLTATAHQHTARRLRHTHHRTGLHTRPPQRVHQLRIRLDRLTDTAHHDRLAVGTGWRSVATDPRPSRSILATVWLTVGPLWSSRSAIRARMETTPSSSSSRMVRRYISVVSISPDIRAPR